MAKRFEKTIESLNKVSKAFFAMRKAHVTVDIEDVILGFCDDAVTQAGLPDINLLRLDEPHAFYVYKELFRLPKMIKDLRSQGFYVDKHTDVDEGLASLALFNLVCEILKPLTDDKGDFDTTDFKLFCETASDLLRDLKDSDIIKLYK